MKNFTRVVKGMWRIHKSKLLIFQSKANLDEKILFGKITRHLDPEIRKMPVKAYYRTRIPHSILVYDLLAVEIKMLFQKLTMALNLNFNQGC